MTESTCELEIKVKNPHGHDATGRNCVIQVDWIANGDKLSTRDTVINCSGIESSRKNASPITTQPCLQKTDNASRSPKKQKGSGSAM